MLGEREALGEGADMFFLVFFHAEMKDFPLRVWL